MAQQIQLRNDSTTAWEAENPVLAQAEIGVDTTLGKFKIGDGESTWTELDYYANEDLTLPTSIKDTNGADLIVFEKGGTGVARIDAVQDDLALRSARDIILYPGDDGEGKVYINWGDANYTPNATNEVATLADVDEAVSNGIGNIGLSNIKTVIWAYPSDNAVAIMPETDGESISIKSSDSAAVRWHLRDNPPSLGNNGPISATSATVVDNGNGTFNVTFELGTQQSIPVNNYHYYISSEANPSYNGSWLAVNTDIDSITLEYDLDPGVFNVDTEITQPSKHNEVRAQESGVQVITANWTEDPTYSNYWEFGTDGVLSGPSMGGLVVNGLTAAAETDLYVYASSGQDVFVSNDNTQAQIGYRYLPQVDRSSNFTLELSHMGKHIYNTASGRIQLTIPTHSSVAFPIGTEIKVVNDASADLDIVRENTETMILIAEGQNYTGQDTIFYLPTNGLATLLKISNNKWIVSGIRVTD